MKRVLVIYKKTALQRYGENDPTIRRLLDAEDKSVAVLRHAHESHLRSLARVRVALKKLGVQARFRHRHDGGSDAWDMVVTVGGDGTLLWASHQVDANTPMLALNSAPASSVGYFCAGNGEDAEDLLALALSGDMRAACLTRMQVEVDGEVHSTRVLNDILFCSSVPAAATRYLIKYDEVLEPHTSSGIWAGPAAGSTAAQRSAGGEVLPIESQDLQWVVREPYRPGDTELKLARGLIVPGTSLSIKSKIRDGRIYLDGASRVLNVDIGQEVQLRRSSETLSILGLRR